MKTLLPALLAPTLLAACSATPRYDADFGASVRDIRMAMTLNPVPAKAGDPVAGIDGAAGREAINRYRDSFKEPPPPINVINIGGAIGSHK